MTMFSHFLVTRFNLRVDTWETSKGGAKVLTDEWYEERFRLFETYCFPSVKNQADQDFVWCIYFDTMTTSHYRNKIEQITASYPVIRLFFIDGIKDLQVAFQSYIRSAAQHDNQFVITSRLDNDDLLHTDFIKHIKHLFQPIHQTVIDIRTGYQLCIEKEHAEIRFLMNRFNPFVSLIEEVSKAETVLSRMHREWEAVDNVIVVDYKRLWIELIHQSNKLNEVNRHHKKLCLRLLADYGLTNNILKFESTGQIFLFNLGLRINSFFGRIKARFNV